MCDLNIEFEKLESTESVDSAQAATATSHKKWLDTKAVVQRKLSRLVSSSRALKEMKTQKGNEAFNEYYNQGELRTCDHQTYLIQIGQI